jgi:hypothetical protein
LDAETGAALPLNEVGLLEARGSQLPGDGAWQRTTDLAAIDEDGTPSLKISRALVREQYFSGPRPA